MRLSHSKRPFSLLYPSGCNSDPTPNKWGEQTIADLGVDKIVLSLSSNADYQERIKQILFELPGDPQIIRYRQEILGDFLRSPNLVAGFKELLPLLARLHDQALAQGQEKDDSLQSTLGRLTELNLYIRCVRQLQAILAESQTRSQGLLELRDGLEEIIQNQTYQSLEESLPDLLKKLNSVPSITIGVNLNHELMPIEATLLSVNEAPFKGGSFLDRLVGKKISEKHNQGVGPLHAVPFQVGYDSTRVVQSHVRVDPLMVPLFKDLYKVIKSVIAPISNALRQFAHMNENYVIGLESEVAFYLGAVALMERMQSYGLPMCCPKILPMQERSCQVQGMYNISLALRVADNSLRENDICQEIVSNDVDFNADGDIFILTGPNQGGKTMYTQGVGLMQVLFQAGLHIPAENAAISPVDGIYTHFVTEEKLKPGTGRLAEEAQRLSEIFESITPQSLVLLNESLSSTSHGESLYLARDIVSALSLYGVRAIFATHLHELAEDVEKFNSDAPGAGRLVSLVAIADESENGPDKPRDAVRRTYKIERCPPRGLSYAKGIATRYGISYEQLAQGWQEGEKNVETTLP